MDVERLLLRVVTYGAYGAGVIGAAGTLGWDTTPAWLLLAVAGLIPGGFLLAKDMARREREKEAARHAPEQLRPSGHYRPPGHYAPRDAGPAPEALSPPQ